MKKNIKKVHFLIQNWENPGSRYRVLQYLPYLKESSIETDVTLFPGSFIQWMNLIYRIQSYSALFVQKKRLRPWQLWYLRHKKFRIIYDFDDAIMHKSPGGANYKSSKRQRTFARMVRYADRVISGNQYLKARALPYNKNVTVIPTAINTTKYTLKDYNEKKEKITLGWIGSKSSLPFLKDLMPVFDHLGEQYHHVELKIICNEFFDCDKIPVIKKLWEESGENADLQDIDIGIAPLPDHEWSKGKCATKLLQYFSVGIPAVCSAIGVHNEIVKEGSNGFLAGSPKEWIEKINFLINNKELRERIGREGNKTVESEFSLEANIPKFVDAIVENSTVL